MLKSISALRLGLMGEIYGKTVRGLLDVRGEIFALLGVTERFNDGRR